MKKYTNLKGNRIIVNNEYLVFECVEYVVPLRGICVLICITAPLSFYVTELIVSSNNTDRFII